MKQAYLTIDDSPTKHTKDLVNWLNARDIPAVFFCIGGAYEDLGLPCEGIEQRPDDILHAIERGYIIGNHTYSHPRFSNLTLEDMKSEVLKNEQIIDHLYRRAGKSRPVKLFRFRDIDRGCGTWVVDFNKTGVHTTVIQDLFWKGVNLKPVTPTAADFEKKDAFQEFLKAEGFTTNIYEGVNFDWYRTTEMADAADSLYTYSTSDWMVNPDFAAYAKDWAYNSCEALAQKIDDDPWLNDETQVNIVLAHDHNNLFDRTTRLLDHMIQRGVVFKEIAV
ncbi:MAG: polysaccharide deacetylase family protein [Rhodospirillales bacterium]|nr:polysaccharide deacetylase family protein [Rhodospirillales bacterium]